MRVVIVGTAKDRERLKHELLDTPIDVVAEADTLADARAFDGESDGILLATFDSGRGDEGGSEGTAVEPLTARELDVLELLAEGLPNKSIAGRLGISDQTVKFHVAAICGKLGASNRTEAVRLAIRRGLVAI